MQTYLSYSTINDTNIVIITIYLYFWKKSLFIYDSHNAIAFMYKIGRNVKNLYKEFCASVNITKLAEARHEW